jgi:hypothetical protein
MEPLVFALIAVRNGYRWQDAFVPEPAEFRLFDLRALKRSYDAQDDSSGRPSDRQGGDAAQQVAVLDCWQASPAACHAPLKGLYRWVAVAAYGGRPMRRLVE